MSVVLALGFLMTVVTACVVLVVVVIELATRPRGMHVSSEVAEQMKAEARARYERRHP